MDSPDVMRQGARDGWWMAVAATAATACGVAGAVLVPQRQFAAGWVLLGLGVALLLWPRSLWQGGEEVPLDRRRRRLALLAVCALGVFFRTYRLTPPGLWGDDAVNGLLAFDVLDGKIQSPFELITHSFSRFHALSNYFIAGFFWAFGPGLTTLRLPGIIAGALCVPLLYGTMAPLFGARAALIAAAFFASAPMQVTHSKELIQVMLGEFFQLAGLCLLVRGATGPRRWLMALAGVPLALCLYTYHAAKLAPLVAFPYVLAVWFEARPRRRSLGLWALAGIGVFAACALPAVYSYVGQLDSLTGRIGGTSLLPEIRARGLAPLWEAFWRTLLVFHYEQGPQYHWFGLGFDPALNCVVAAFLLHGLVRSLWRWREPRHLLLLSWVVVGLIPGWLSTEAPRAYRVLLATPPLYLWAALPIARLAAYTADRGPARAWLRGLAALLVLAVPAIDFNYYFYRLYTHPLFHWFQAERMVEAAREMQQRGPGWTGYLLCDTFDANHESMRFLARAWGLDMRNVVSLSEVLPLREPSGGALFMLTGGTMPAAAAIRLWYPDAVLDQRHQPQLQNWMLNAWLPLGQHWDTDPNSHLAFMAVPPQAKTPRGLATVFQSDAGVVLTRRVDPQPKLAGVADLPHGLVAAHTVRWSGALVAPQDGSYRLALDSSAPARVWVDGLEAVSSERPGAAQELAAGPHLFAVEATVADPPALRVRWEPPGGATEEIPPAQLFDIANGMLAEYTVGGRTLRRLEPYPFFAFFPAVFREPATVRWSGRLQVPPPHHYQLTTRTNGAARLAIDGRPWPSEAKLAPGTHTLEIELRNLPVSPRFALEWQATGRPAEAVPPTALSPP